jgi:hypothetical protein
MKKIVLLILGIACCKFIYSCGSESDVSEDTTASSTAWANASMQAVVTNNCATSGCHNGTQSPNYKTITEANMKADTSALARVNADTMPPGAALGTSNKETFQNFYK